ncbi:DUF262 domain-containing protein [bacterium]|nr:DUF262 domain-containing protein [bacterium]
MRSKKVKTSFPPINDNGFCSIGDLVGCLPQLGLPHFQRGQVWNDSSISRLLESLMLDTPCGSLILWAPQELQEVPDEIGVPVQMWGTESLDYLVVDGQQRLTALSRVFKAKERWAINLAAIPELRAVFDKEPSPRLRRRNLFLEQPTKLNNEASAGMIGRRKAELQDLVLLDNIQKQGEDAWPYSALRPDIWSKLVSGIQGILNRQLQVVIKREECLEEMVRLYNRINSSGEVVKQEERAFAAMFRFNANTGTWLKDNFAAVHGNAAVNRNDALKRQRERLFGFRLFVRTFTQIAAHHMGQNDKDLSRLDEWLWDDRWMELSEERLEVFGIAGVVIKRVADVLRESLCCDDFRFLPSAEALRPVFTLICRFPDVEDSVLARCLLSLQLSRSVVVKCEEPQHVLSKIRHANTLEKALDCFPVLGDEQELLNALETSQSMQDSWVSLLYWFQRSRMARDYGGIGFSGKSYDSCSSELNAASLAHKEHIVPFSLLHPAYEELEAKGGHSRAHIVNSIGNLTFVSENFNYAHGSDPIRLWEIDRHLLSPHQLSREKTLLRYRSAIQLLSEGNFEAGREAYCDFISVRVKNIASEMHLWLTEKMEVTAGKPNKRPKAQLIHPSAEDEVRAMLWPVEFEEEVLKLIGNASTSGKVWILYREGAGSERIRVANQIRLRRDGALLTVGKHTEYSSAITDALKLQLVPEECELQRSYRLDPQSPTATEIIRALVNTKPWIEPDRYLKK